MTPLTVVTNAIPIATSLASVGSSTMRRYARVA